jgi:hypothetical protein
MCTDDPLMTGIVWTVTNALFLPVLYFLYPETGNIIPDIESAMLDAKKFLANRSLEDIDAYYRSNPSLIVTTDADATFRKRPQKYVDREDEELERTTAGKGAQLVAAEHVEDKVDK